MAPRKCYSVLDLNQSNENRFKSTVRPVTAELEAARKLNLERNRLPPKRETSVDVIKPLYLRQKRQKTSEKKRSRPNPDQILWKLEYPKPPKYKKCQHFDNLLIDRQILTRKEHIEVLSKPRKTVNSKDRRFWARYVPRSIPPMTNRMNQLAQPNKRNLIHTWKQYAPILTGQQIDKFQGILASYEVMDNKSAAQYLKQCRRDERLRKKFRKSEMKRLRKDLERMQVEQIKEVILRVFNEIKGYLLGHQEYHLDPEMSQISEKILQMIRKYMKCTETNQLKTRALKILADKITVWAEEFLKAAKFDTDVKCASVSDRKDSIESEIEGYPIDDFIVDVEESLVTEEDYSEYEDEESGKQETDPETLILVQTLVESLLGMTFACTSLE